MVLTYILPAMVLLSGVIDDLRSKKIHNYLIIALLAISVLLMLILNGFSGFLFGLGTLVLGLCLSAPLFYLKVLGGGDVKLFAVLSFLLSARFIFYTLICAFFWGAVLGLFKAFLDKKLGLIFLNLFSIFKFKKVSADSLYKMPFSVSLFLGWLSAFYF